MKYDPYGYEMPWRPNYEAYYVFIWWGGAVTYLLMAKWEIFPVVPMLIMASMCFAFSLWLLPQAIRLNRLHKKLAGFRLEFTKLGDLQQTLSSKEHADMMWLGRGFKWTKDQTQGLMQLSQRNEAELLEQVQRQWRRDAYIKEIKNGGFLHWSEMKKRVDTIGVSVADEMGLPWIHGLGNEDKDLWQKIDHANGHSVIFGTTGAGKTRFFDLVISQAIMRGEAVIIIDPKGDRDMEENARNACRALGRENDFKVFHLGHPEQSIHINPIANWSNQEEIANRIRALLPQGGNNDVFAGFAWSSINTIVKCLLLCSIQPTLTRINTNLIMGVNDLLCQSIAAWMRVTLGEDKAEAIIGRIRDHSGDNSFDFIKDLIRFYRVKMSDTPHPAVNEIISMYEHDAEHFSKMIASVLPILSKLTSGNMGPLLSPTDNNKEKSAVEFYDFSTLIKKKNVVYVGLDTLTNAEVGAAVGSIMLADLTAVAGDRYKFDQKIDGSVNLFVDEANEVANGPFLQLLNKSRGAGFRIFVATQTYSDFVSRLGNSAEANRVMANCNNLFALRTLDPDTQEFIIGRLPKTKINEIQRDQGVNTHSSEPIFIGNSLRESLKATEVDLFPAPYLGKLPGLEYIGVISGGHVIKGRIPILIR